MADSTIVLTYGDLEQLISFRVEASHLTVHPDKRTSNNFYLLRVAHLAKCSYVKSKMARSADGRAYG